MKKELRERMEETTGRLLEEWQGRHRKYPDYLWHYTSIAGVRGILTEGHLWFSDAAFLNDSSELSYAVDVAERVIEPKLAKEVSSPLVKEFLQRFLTRIRNDRESRQAHGLTTSAFVACFCEEMDSLHLWRAYTGNGRGYSIGFFPGVIDTRLKPLQLQRAIRVQSSGEALRKFRYDTPLYEPSLRAVIYEEAEQNDILSGAIDAFCQILVDFESDLQSEDKDKLAELNIIERLFSLFCQYLCCFKHPTFKEEREWRFIYTPVFPPVSKVQEGLAKKGIEYREAGGYLVPYFRVNIAETSEVTEESDEVEGNENIKVIQIPFDAIISGPGLDKRLARASLHSFLESKGHSYVDIDHSSVPLRNIC